MEQRRELMNERHTLPGRYWAQPDEEDLKRLEEEYRQQHMDGEDENLPFV